MKSEDIFVFCWKCNHRYKINNWEISIQQYECCDILHYYDVDGVIADMITTHVYKVKALSFEAACFLHGNFINSDMIDYNNYDKQAVELYIKLTV
jgi:glucose-6-phosphate 1-dehydrogenase